MTLTETIAQLRCNINRALPHDFNDETVERAHRAIRRQMVIQRGGYAACCDLCGDGSSMLHMHELCNRGRIRKGTAARWVSYQPEITTILCEACHESAHNPAVRDTLFRLNYRRYGADQVQLVYRLLVSVIGFAIGVNLPDVFED